MVTDQDQRLVGAGMVAHVSGEIRERV
jgi:hypothetical protein